MSEIFIKVVRVYKSRFLWCLETYSAEDHLTQKVCEANFFDDGKYISIMAVGGPYTTSNTFDFAPLGILLFRTIFLIL